MQVLKVLSVIGLAVGTLAPLSAHAEARLVAPQPSFVFAPGDPHGGRYEWREATRWVPGNRVETWMPGHCWRGYWGALRCEPSHPVVRWVPGHYQRFSERVWVPFAPPPGFARPY